MDATRVARLAPFKDLAQQSLLARMLDEARAPEGTTLVHEAATMDTSS